ncbi:MAG: hypothetical protein QNJ51_24335 [Calothrix sp. MO_167.B12]|nr:hypothetical protein [Calothrix sp. MO_167.B12]
MKADELTNIAQNLTPVFCYFHINVIGTSAEYNLLRNKGSVTSRNLY